MMVRKYRPEDAEYIQKIYDTHHSGQFGVPHLDFVLSSCVVEKDGKIVGYGCLEKILEGVMILDLSLNLRDKIEAVGHIISSGKIAARLNGYERYYSFPSPNTFARLLEKHFEFKECDKIYHLEVR